MLDWSRRRSNVKSVNNSANIPPFRSITPAFAVPPAYLLQLSCVMNDRFPNAHFCVFLPHRTIQIKQLALGKGPSNLAAVEVLFPRNVKLAGLAQGSSGPLNSNIFLVVF